MSTHRWSRSASPCVHALVVCCCVVASVASVARDARAGFTPFRPGEVVFTNFSQPNAVTRFDPATRQTSIVNGAGLLTIVRGLSFAPDGTLYACDDANGILRLDPVTGAFRRTNIDLGGDLALDLAVAPDGSIVYAPYHVGGLVRADPSTGKQTLLTKLPGTDLPKHSSYNFLFGPDGQIYGSARLEPGPSDFLYRFNATTGQVTWINSDGDGIVVEGVRGNTLIYATANSETSSPLDLLGHDLNSGTDELLLPADTDTEGAGLNSGTFVSGGRFLAADYFGGKSRIASYDPQTWRARVLLSMQSDGPQFGELAVAPGAPAAIPLPPAALAAVVVIPLLARARRRVLRTGRRPDGRVAVGLEWTTGAAKQSSMISEASGTAS